MFNRFDFLDLMPSHYEEQIRWGIELTGPTSPGAKVVMNEQGILTDLKGNPYKAKPKYEQAEELTEGQKCYLQKLKSESEEYKELWDQGFRPIFTNSSKIKIRL